MKERTGKECKKVKCTHFKAYADWGNHMGTGEHQFCMNCKNAFVSQYEAHHG